MLDFMLRHGLWAAATEMRSAQLRKANCGPLLKDAYLMERIGLEADLEAGSDWQRSEPALTPASLPQ